MISHRLIPAICGLLLAMSYSVLMNDASEAQLSQNTLESIVKQPDALTSAQLSVGDNPTFIAADRYDAVYVANSGSNTVSVINPATNTVIKNNIPVGKEPNFIAANRDDAVYVANSGSNTVSVINPATNTVIKNITTVGDSPSFIYAGKNAVYVANSGSDTMSVINATTNTVIKNITVGDSPSFIAEIGYIYVANSGSPIDNGPDTVSVINATTNTVIKNITVGDSPSFFGTLWGTLKDPNAKYVYVANSGSGSNTVSVISATTNDVIKNITVNGSPILVYVFQDSSDEMAREALYVATSADIVSVINPTTNTVIKNITTIGHSPKSITANGHAVYVANYDSNTVSVINATTNTVIKNITTIGHSPKSIAANRDDAVYVANLDSDTVSVINPSTNEVIAGVTFDITPFRGGQIICNGLDAPINRYFYVSSDAKCEAKPNNGFEFSSWTQNLAQNSTITVNASTTSDWLADPVAALRDAFADDPAATLTINRFGNFTAYFRALPPPVPAEFTFSLITIIVTALVGSLLIPAAVGWFKSKKQTSRLNSFHQQMAVVYSDGKVDEGDINTLEELNKSISDSYANGKITNDQYTNLKSEVSAAYQKIFKKRIDSISDSNTEAFNNIKNEIEDAYSDRKITELDYNLLNGKISRILDKK